MKRTFLTSALDMPEIMSYIYSKSWKLQFSASSSIIILEDYYLQTFLHSLEKVFESACLADSKTCCSGAPPIILKGQNPLSSLSSHPTAKPHCKATQQNPPALQRNSTAHSAVVILTPQLLSRPI